MRCRPGFAELAAVLSLGRDRRGPPPAGRARLRPDRRSRPTGSSTRTRPAGRCSTSASTRSRSPSRRSAEPDEIRALGHLEGGVDRTPSSRCPGQPARRRSLAGDVRGGDRHLGGLCRDEGPGRDRRARSTRSGRSRVSAEGRPARRVVPRAEGRRLRARDRRGGALSACRARREPARAARRLDRHHADSRRVPPPDRPDLPRRRLPLTGRRGAARARPATLLVLALFVLWLLQRDLQRRSLARRGRGREGPRPRRGGPATSGAAPTRPRPSARRGRGRNGARTRRGLGLAAHRGSARSPCWRSISTSSAGPGTTSILTAQPASAGASTSSPSDCWSLAGRSSRAAPGEAPPACSPRSPLLALAAAGLGDLAGGHPATSAAARLVGGAGGFAGAGIGGGLRGLIGAAGAAIVLGAIAFVAACALPRAARFARGCSASRTRPVGGGFRRRPGGSPRPPPRRPGPNRGSRPDRPVATPAHRLAPRRRRRDRHRAGGRAGSRSSREARAGRRTARRDAEPDLVGEESIVTAQHGIDPVPAADFLPPSAVVEQLGLGVVPAPSNWRLPPERLLKRSKEARGRPPGDRGARQAPRGRSGLPRGQRRTSSATRSARPSRASSSSSPRASRSPR